MKHKRILFFYPSRSIGGAQTLFLRLAELFVIRGHIVTIMDYSDGYLRGNLPQGVGYIEYSEGGYYLFDKKMTVLTPLSSLCDIEKIIEISDDSKFLYWGIHPDNLTGKLRGWQRVDNALNLFKFLFKCLHISKYRKIKKKLEVTYLKGDVFFMDLACKERALDFFKIRDNASKYVPIPFGINKCANLHVKKDDFSVAWVGRLGGEKIHSLLFFLKSLNSTGHPWKVLIVGDGKCIEMIYKKDFPNLSLIFAGYIQNENLNNVLISNSIGLVAGMGTSILETSYMQIPSILLDPSYTELPENYKPRWVFNIENYTLGTFNYVGYRKGGECFSVMINDYLNDTDNEIGKKCFSYTNEKHSIDKTCDLIENLL